jgi:hypothetical protein
LRGVMTGPAVLDIGGDTGAIVVYADELLDGEEVEVVSSREPGRVSHNVVRKRWAGSRDVHAAVFPAVEAGEYTILEKDGVSSRAFVVRGGSVAVVDCTKTTGSPQDQ